MACANCYATLAQFKTHAGIVDSASDVKIEQVLESVSRTIDRHCGRIFYLEGSDTTRYYTPYSATECVIDDTWGLDELASDDGSGVFTVWDEEDFDTLPLNAALDYLPVTAIQVSRTGSKRFIAGVTGSVRVLGTRGVPASCPWIPAVREAALIQTYRIFKRADAPFGILGGSQTGELVQLSELDADVAYMLRRPITRTVKPC